MNKTMLRLLPYFLLVVMLAAIGIFLFSRGDNSGGKAKYISGTVELELDGTAYSMVNDILAEEYVGSQVKSVVSATRGEQAGIVKSMGFTLAKLFRVKGDAEGRYLIDNVGRLYARADIAGEVKTLLSSESGFPVSRIVTADHTPETARELTAEDVEMLRALPANGAEVTVTDKSVVTDYSNRREIFAFTEDGLIYKVTMELFRYQNAVYLTTGFSGDKNTMKDQKLTGVKLPDEQQERFAEFWK